MVATLLREAGAVAYGITEIAPVEEAEWEMFERWIAKGFHAGMRYMENYPEIRRNPSLLLDGAKTIISVAFNYRQPNPFKKLATYALGEDYHKVLRRRLKKVAGALKDNFGGDWRICIDSAPILERYWAIKCGVGRRSPVHGNVIVEGVGSMVFLSEIITTLPLKKECGVFVARGAETQENVSRAVCPTGALQEGGTVDCRKCINYLTIEKKEELTPEEMRLVGNSVFGCDACQAACVENKGGFVEILPEFHPLPGLQDFIDNIKLEEKESAFDLSKSPLKRGRRFKAPGFNGKKD